MKVSKTLLLVAAVLLLLISVTGVSAASPSDDDNRVNFAPDEILVKFNPGVISSEAAQIHRQHGGQVKETMPAIGVQVVSIARGQASEKIRAYSADPRVAYAEPNFIAQAVGNPDDAYFDKQWGMIKVEAPQAWEVTTGSIDVNIAILDTGIDLGHPDLASKVKASINFTGSATATDYYGHGTHVAGIAAASTNNGIGVAGLGYNSTLMNVKVLGDDGSGYYSWIAQGVTWAADNGAEVINLSLGGSSPSLTLESAVNYAWGKGVVVVAAAGNSGSSAPFYPAYYTNSVAVAATDASDSLPSWSNRGDWVDVAAPGVSIYSTLKDNGYGYKTGTSMASPHTAGLAALLFSVVADFNGNGLLNDEVRSRIEANCDDIGLSGVGSGRINAYKAVSGLSPATGSIAGTVIDAADGVPLAGASVSDGVRTASTDANGWYTIADVPPGSYTVTASASGYASLSQIISVAAGQTSTVNFVLTRIVPPTTKPMWVDSITFRLTGNTLRLSIRVAEEGGAVAGAQVAVKLVWSGGQSWNFSGTTDSLGIASFLVPKAPVGVYVATVTSLTTSGYTWDTAQGVISASYTLNRSSGKSGS